MRINKNNRGGAYISVLMTTMILFLLVSVALTINEASRRITAHYASHASLYDMALAGNEQLFTMLSLELKIYLEDNPHQDREEIKNLLISFLEKNFMKTQDIYHKNWSVSFWHEQKGIVTEEIYQASSRISTGPGGGFTVKTSVYKILNGQQSYPAAAEAEIHINNFDAYSLSMVKSKRIAN